MQRHENGLRFLFASLIAWLLLMSATYPAQAQDTAAGAPMAWQTGVATEDEALGVVARVPYANANDLRQLSGRLDVWEVDYAQQTLLALLSAPQYRALRAAGYAITVDWTRTAKIGQLQGASTSTESGIPNYTCYRTVEETYTALEQLAADQPNLAQWIDIGDSWQKTQASGGYDLHALVITNRDRPGPKGVLFLMGAIHARELTTAETTTRFAEKLVTGYGADPDITWLLDYNEIHIVPQVNPDGRKRAEAGRLWRKNTNNTDGSCDPAYIGVDLNRNSSFKWNVCGFGCSSGDPCDLTYRGHAPASEPEVAALENYMRTIFPDQRGPDDDDPAPADATGLMITLHSYGEWVLFPWGWTPTKAPNDAPLRTLGRKFGYYTGYTVCQAGETGCIYPTDGTTDDFAYGELGVAAYTFELGTDFFEACSYYESNIVDSILSALMIAAKHARQPYITPAGPEIIQATVTPTQVVAGGEVSLTLAIDSARYATNHWAFGVEAVQPISAAHFTIDAPNWITGTATYSLTLMNVTPDGLRADAQATVDTTGWDPGWHLVFALAQDAGDDWGAPTAVYICITALDGDTTACGSPAPHQDHWWYLPFVAGE